MMPLLHIDQLKCLRNIERMARKASTNALQLRPHFKTHQSVRIGEWFRDFDVTSITVSSFQMAARFSRAGWKDILVAFPFVPGEIDHLNALAEHRKLSVLIDHPDQMRSLKELRYPAGFYLDIDTGYGRTGVPAEDEEGLDILLKHADQIPLLHFKGFYAHAGHSYLANTPGERLKIHREAMKKLGSLKNTFRERAPRILYGDTPNCSTQDEFPQVDEITPGNFIFYDLFQYRLGSCSLDDIAAALLCPVAGKYRPGRRILIHGGAVHLSKESLEMDGRSVYGLVARAAGKGWKIPEEHEYLSSLSQEHGILDRCGSLFDQTDIGEQLYILPVHSCLAANLSRRKHIVEH